MYKAEITITATVSRDRDGISMEVVVLTDAALKALKPEEKPYKVTDRAHSFAIEFLRWSVAVSGHRQTDCLFT
ncbi:hypothetical protein [Rhizobium sp. BR 315]|uniref:hypothetical protein n=1 Tax=Rhizobium sp. BR 315 TaxID=3040014 RepID=UPI003D33397C